VVERHFQSTVSSETVAAASRWARDLAADLRLGHQDSYRIDLVLSEIVQNAVDHIDLADAELPLEVHAEIDRGTLRLTVVDAGAAFDPLSVPFPAQPENIEAATLGGLGVHLVREFSERCGYERRGDRNRFEAVFALAPPATATPAAAAIPRGTDRRGDAGTVRFPLQRSDGSVTAQDQRSVRDRRLAGFISRSEIFRDVPYAQVEEIVAAFPIKDVIGRTILLRPGDHNDHVLIVLQGTLRVYFDHLESPEYVEIFEGGCVGEMSIIDDKPISAFVVADPSCRLLLIDRESFLTRVITLSRVARNLLSTLTERMRRSNETIIEQLKSKIELEQLQRDLRHAQTIQESMLPRGPLFGGRTELDCAGKMRAAKEVGGDFYDAFPIDAGRIFVAIGDVCNKGMPAALFMVRALTTLRSEISRTAQDMRRHLQSAVERLNSHLYASNDAQQFVSLFCGVLDIDRGMLTYVNGGHNPPLVSVDGVEFEFLGDPVNPIVGIVDGLRFEAGELKMPAGSTLLLYTDGITEAEDSRGEMFGEERLKALARRAGGATAASLVDEMIAAVDEFSAGTVQSDDITVLAVRLLDGAPGT